ncbi:MAG: hypothetical protein ACK5DD_08580 [Cyclobacteriaceae bacterium]|jgi:hypothetical protein
MKKQLIVILLLAAGFSAPAQTKPDSVVVKVGKASKVVVTVGDKADLETFRKYNFQQLMDDIIQKLDVRDTSQAKPASEYERPTEAITSSPEKEIEVEKEEQWETVRPYKSRRRTTHNFVFDLGINNLLDADGFPSSGDPYAVHPWGSWYVGLNSIQRTRIANKFFLEWGGGVSWYNFKFENERTILSKDENGIIFGEDLSDVDYRKSKLTVTHLNLSLVPVLDFGNSRHKPTFFNDTDSRSFRIGVGGYLGYRIDSYSKQTYFENGDRRRNHDHDSYYLNPLRYGVRLQMGFGDTELFVDYDLNELFEENKGPKLNALTFGVSF